MDGICSTVFCLYVVLGPCKHFLKMLNRRQMAKSKRYTKIQLYPIVQKKQRTQCTKIKTTKPQTFLTHKKCVMLTVVQDECKW